MHLLLYLSYLMLISPPLTKPNSDTTNPADEVLKKMTGRLNGLRTIQYMHKREIHYPSKNYENELTGKVYLDFTSKDNIIGIRYFFKGNPLILAFNGSESFICNTGNKTIDINRTPEKKDMENLSFLNHSIFSLKKALPWIISDKSIDKYLRDTVIGKESYYQVFLSLKKDMIGTLGERWFITDPVDIKYRLLINQKTYLPFEIYQGYSNNDDWLKTSFTDIELNKQLENESMFYYSSYLDQYKETLKTDKPLIQPGKFAYDWQLRSLRSDKLVSLSGYKGKLVLIEFWICHCSYCITAAGELNEIYKKYKDQNFDLVAINAYDSPEMIRKFMENVKPIDYEILYNGEKTRLQYGVAGFPTMVLVNKNGIVIYSGSFNREKIEALIKTNL